MEQASMIEDTIQVAGLTFKQFNEHSWHCKLSGGVLIRLNKGVAGDWWVCDLSRRGIGVTQGVTQNDSLNPVASAYHAMLTNLRGRIVHARAELKRLQSLRVLPGFEKGGGSEPF